MNKQSFIWVTVQKSGTHSYKTAPEEVAFLRNEHRHLFKVEVAIEVFHNDRDIEFIMFRDFVYRQVSAILDGHNMSCEGYSDMLFGEIRKQYPNRDIRISFSEDGENGSKVYYPKPKV